MMRSFLTRLVNSVTRVVLPVPCLLICLACATPFPFEKLDKGMTTEAAREKFGAPERITARQGKRVRWCYEHEEKPWNYWVATFFPLTYIAIPLHIALVGGRWDDLFVEKKPVVLDFEGEKLVRLDVYEPLLSPGTPRWEQPLPGTNRGSISGAMVNPSGYVIGSSLPRTASFSCDSIP